MIRYGRSVLFPSDGRTVALWRSAGSDNYLRLAQPDTDCPPDPTALILDDGVTEPDRYRFFRVNRSPDGERSWLIKGRARTSYTAFIDGFVEFLPFLYVGSTANPTENNLVDGDAPDEDDGSGYPYSPSSVSPVKAGDVGPASPSIVSYYYVVALVQQYGSAGYRGGYALRVGVSSVDTVVTVEPYYVLFVGRQCVGVSPAPAVWSWADASWIRLTETGGQVQLVVDGTVVLSHTGSLGTPTPYQLMLMESVLGNLSTGVEGEWPYLGGQLWLPFVPIGRVSGVRSGYTQREVVLPVSEASDGRVRVRVRLARAPSVWVSPSAFRSGGTTYPSEDAGSGFYRPQGNPAGAEWSVVYAVSSVWNQPMLLELYEVETTPEGASIVAEWVGTPAGVMGSVASARWRASGSSEPVRIYLRRGGVETLWATVPAPAGGHNDEWNPFEWVRVPPRGAFELVFRLEDKEARLEGVVEVAPSVSLRWVSPSRQAVGGRFEVETIASGSDATLVVETVHGTLVQTRRSYPPPSRGWWDGDAVATDWLASLPYGEFTVRARLENAVATLTGETLAPLLEAEWVSPARAPVGATMRIRVRALASDAPIRVFIARAGVETFLREIDPHHNEWHEVSWDSTPPAGSFEWVVRLESLERRLWGVLEVERGTPPYVRLFWLGQPYSTNYWVVRSPNEPSPMVLGGPPLIVLGGGWGLPDTHQGRLLEIRAEPRLDT